MKHLYLLLFLSFSLSRILYAQDTPGIGDIPFDSKLDNPKFQLCNTRAWQGYEWKTADDETMRWISNHLKERYIAKKEWSGQNGYITVRFVVNCLGLTDRFRGMGVSEDLKASSFNKELISYLIKLAKEEAWPIGTYNQKSLDYYHKVIFKIVNGQLKEVVI